MRLFQPVIIELWFHLFLGYYGCFSAAQPRDRQWSTEAAGHVGSLPVTGLASASVVISAVQDAVMSSSFITVNVVPVTNHLFRRKRRALRTLRAASPVIAVQSRLRIASATLLRSPEVNTIASPGTAS